MCLTIHKHNSKYVCSNEHPLIALKFLKMSILNKDIRLNIQVLIVFYSLITMWLRENENIVPLILVKLMNFSKLQFSHLSNGG